MTHDTSKDPRLLVARHACALLEKCTKLRSRIRIKVSRQRQSELASACESAVMALTYSYQEPAALSQSPAMTTLDEATAALTEAFSPLTTSKEDASMLRANLRWCLRTLTGLARRLENPGSSLASGVDLVVVQVRHAQRSGDLFATHVTDGREDYAVQTNLPEVHTGSALAAAFLPPREIGGVVSEAMYLGSESRSEPVGTLLTDGQADAREAAGMMYEAQARHSR